MTVRLSDTGRFIMDRLQEHYGLSQASIIEMLLREDARRLGIIPPVSGAASKARRDAGEDEGTYRADTPDLEAK